MNILWFKSVQYGKHKVSIWPTILCHLIREVSLQLWIILEVRVDVLYRELLVLWNIFGLISLISSMFFSPFRSDWRKSLLNIQGGGTYICTKENLVKKWKELTAVLKVGPEVVHGSKSSWQLLGNEHPLSRTSISSVHSLWFNHNYLKILTCTIPDNIVSLTFVDSAHLTMRIWSKHSKVKSLRSSRESDDKIIHRRMNNNSPMSLGQTTEAIDDIKNNQRSWDPENHKMTQFNSWMPATPLAGKNGLRELPCGKEDLDSKKSENYESRTTGIRVENKY